MKSRIAGCTHHETKVVQRLADGGTVMATQKNSDGSQQYVSGGNAYTRGKTIDKNIRATDDAMSKAVSTGKYSDAEKMRKAKRLLGNAEYDNKGAK